MSNLLTRGARSSLGLAVAAMAVALAVAGACTDLKDVSQPSCTFGVAPMTLSVQAAGGTSKLAVTASGVCAWSVTDLPSWITVSDGSSGTGDGSVTLVVGTNAGFAPRAGTLTVAGQKVTVNQGASPCRYTLSPSSESFGASGGGGRVNLATADPCAWTASANAPWVHFTSDTSGTGSAALSYAVDQNPSKSGRSTTLTIGGQSFGVDQGGFNCTYTVAPSDTSFGSSGGDGSVSVSAEDGCGWTAVSNASWLHVTAGGSGSGRGTVRFSVDGNGGSERRGTLTVAGHELTITQASGTPLPPPPPACSFTINAGPSSFTGDGGTGTVAVSADKSCAWTASSGAPWAHITSGSTGSGNGTVKYTVDSNPLSLPRATTLTVAGSEVTVTQAGSCGFVVLPTSVSFDAAAHTGSIAITTTSGCAWTATANAPWLTIAPDDKSGQGSGVVHYSVMANGKKERTGTLTVAGVTVTISQDGN
jgi:hypothetical protein